MRIKALLAWVAVTVLVGGMITAVAESASAYDHRYGRVRNISKSYDKKTYNETFKVRCVAKDKTFTFTVSSTWKRLGSSKAQHLRSKVSAKKFGSGTLILRTMFHGDGKHSKQRTAYLDSGHLSQSWKASGKYKPFKGSRRLGQLQVDASYIYDVSSTECVPMRTVVVEFHIPKT